MAYKKKNLTPQQRSEQARAAQAARKTHGGGRPKGSLNKERKEPRIMRSIGVYEESYIIFRRLADAGGKTMAETLKAIADKRKEENPALFDNRGLTVNL